MTTDIVIRWCNNLHCRLETDSGISMEVYDEFSFFVPGYKYMPMFKAGRWDGKIKLYDIRNRKFYIGLLPRLIEWADLNGYSISFQDKDEFRKGNIYDQELVEEIYKTSRFVPKEHQKKAVEYALKNPKTLTLSPTASGKSMMMYLLVRYILEHTEDHILITVPNTALVEQLYTDFEDYVSDDFIVSDAVQRLHGDRKEVVHGSRVLISTWQSVYKKGPEFFERFNTYMCDEAHGADAKSISSIVEKLAHADRRFGFTGTLDGTLMHELDMLARFGNLHRVVTTKELMDQGDVAQLAIEAWILKYNDEDRKLVKGAEYQDELNFLVSHKARNKFMCMKALEADGNVIMLFNYIEKHGSILYKMLEPACKELGRPLYYVHGGTDVDDREQIRHILEKTNNAILLASFGTMSTGTNIKNLHHAMFCHPYKAAIKTLQSIGRTLRVSETKKNARLIDFGDDLTYTSKNGKEKANTVFRHFIERLGIYKKERFNYKIFEKSLT